MIFDLLSALCIENLKKKMIWIRGPLKRMKREGLLLFFLFLIPAVILRIGFTTVPKFFLQPFTHSSTFQRLNQFKNYYFSFLVQWFGHESFLITFSWNFFAFYKSCSELVDCTRLYFKSGNIGLNIDWLVKIPSSLSPKLPFLLD